MKRKMISFIIALAMCMAVFMPAIPASATIASNGYDYMFFNYTSFSNSLGTWSKKANENAYSGYLLEGLSDSNKEAQNAEALFVPQKSGTYYVWARTCDFADTAGKRKFLIGVNNGHLQNFLGDSGVDGWYWDYAGEVYLTAGETNKLSLIDFSSYYSRCDAVVITNNPNFEQPAKEQIKSSLEGFLVSGTGTYENKWDGDVYYFNVYSSSDMGSWSIADAPPLSSSIPNRAPINNLIFFGETTGQYTDNSPVVIYANIYEAGTYTLWTRSGVPKRDKPMDSPYRFEINGVTSGDMGYTDVYGYSWEKVGYFTLKKGQNIIKIHDLISSYPRCDAFLFTKDDTCQPSDYISYLRKNPRFYENSTMSSSGYGEFPSYAVQNVTPSSTVSISNADVTVKFHNITSGGNAVVQNEVFYKGDQLKFKTEQFGRIFYNYGGATLKTHERGSPVLEITSPEPFNTTSADWETDGTWGVPVNKMWTNFANGNTTAQTVSNYCGETIKVKLNIPKSGNYYGVTRGNAFDGNKNRGYTVKVNGTELKSSNSTHYFNVTNNSSLQKFAFSYNTDPIYLTAGDVTLELTSTGSLNNGSPMRTSMFALVPANSPSEVEKIISTKMTSYSDTIKNLGGNVLDSYIPSDVLPKTNTGYPHPICYDYVKAVNYDSVLLRANEVYNMGSGSWLIPKSAVQTSSNSVTVTYENDYVTLKEVWTLNAGQQEPEVTMTMTAKKRGNYSVVIPSHDGYGDDEYEYAFLPMQYRGHGIPEKALLTTEQYMFTPMVSVSLPSNNGRVPGKSITYGFAVEPYEQRWVYKDTYKFGATLRGPNVKGMRKVMPVLVAPAQGSEDCLMYTGETYEFKYRPIYRTDDWSGTFQHLLNDLYEFTAYRENYYSSVTDAILNTSDVMMDDEYGGWDANGKGHWNMEGRNITSNSTPLESIQRYLLTDDKNILRERTIPTIINTLTRNSHFKSDISLGGAQDNYVGSSSTWPSKLTGPSSYYGASVYGGINEMSHGGVPYAKELAEQKASEISTSSNAGKSISDLVSMYKYTGDQTYLDKAIKVADNYLVYMQSSINSTNPVSYMDFAYSSYMPFISGLMDIYDVTHEQKYLDAADYAGQVILSLVWTVGMDGNSADKNMTITKKYLSERPFMSNHNFWWHGLEQWRPGTNKGDPAECDPSVHPSLQAGFNNLKDETVPAWVPSRVGIGLEQPSTFYDESLDMIMSSWAGDMMRLAEYTGNDLFEAAARNAIVGRFATYSGYYVNRFVTYQMKSNYLRETPVDFTSVYWHHIPPFLSMIEDFIISQAWNWSNKKIDFPFTRQQGYAYFNNNQYGFEPGKFFDENDMWLWIDRDVVTTSDVNADWIAARKDGVMGIALMNEKDTPITVNVTLGSKADSAYTGMVILYDADGNISYTNASNGVFSVTIPGHSLIGAVIYSNKIKAPSYANISFNNKASTEGTYVEHTDVTGKGMLLQLNPTSYFAHVYIEDTFDNVSRIVVKYTVGADTTVKTASDSEYPFECTMEISDVTKDISYQVEVYNTSGTLTKTSKKYKLSPLGYTTESSENVSEGKTLLITGSNVKQNLKGSYPGINSAISSDGYKYILNDYAIYDANEQITEKPTLSVDIPEAGNYYIYANMRAGHSTEQLNRVLKLNISQNGEEIAIPDKTSSVFKFGYSDDCVTLGSEAVSVTEFFRKGMGFRTPNRIHLEKGKTEITFDFARFAGFDFILITKDPTVIYKMESCVVKSGYSIYKFHSDNTDLKNMLLSYVDVTPSAPPTINRTDVSSVSGLNIKVSDSSADSNLSYIILVNGEETESYLVEDVVKNNGIINIKNIKAGDEIQCIAYDDHSNKSSLSNKITVTKNDIIRPDTYAYLKSGKNYATVSAAETAGALPEDFTIFMTQNNFEIDKTVATKADKNLFGTGNDNYYVYVGGTFEKAYTGTFVIPDTGKATESYQFISSYLRAHNQSTTSPWQDNRRTQFILIDGKALTANGLEEWNGGTSYNGTDNYGTNSYVFGSEYPHEFTDAQNAAGLSKNYPHSVVQSTSHLWGYSPVVKLTPGIHTVEVYAVGGNNWFNDLIITRDIGYDITKLLYGGLGTRETGWLNNYNNVIKPMYTDYTAPQFSTNANISVTMGGNYGKLTWTKAEDEGLGATGSNLAYTIKLKDSNGNIVEEGTSSTNSYQINNLVAGETYTAEIIAVDSTGNKSDVLSKSVTAIAPRPQTFENLTSGTDYSSVEEAKDKLPNGYTVFMTQDNFEIDKNVATETDTNLFTGVKDNLYVMHGSSFAKAYTGTFVIPENSGSNKYQFISSYLRAYNQNGTAPWQDNRRTQFILIDGKAITANGLEEWNGGTSYNGTDNYGTNSYVFGSEYPHEFTDAQNAAGLSKNYPHSVVQYTSHLWGYSPIVELEPGIHTIEVYSTGLSGWFNDLIITNDCGYDITKLLYGGLKTRESGWLNNYNNVIKPLFTDFTAPTFGTNAQISVTDGGSCGILKWTEAEDEGLGASGKVIAYDVKIYDSQAQLVDSFITQNTAYNLKGLTDGANYTAKIKAYDASGNVSGELTGSFTAKPKSVVYDSVNGTVTFYPENNSNLIGEFTVYLVGYNKNTKEMKSVRLYNIDVALNSNKMVVLDTLTDTTNTDYYIFVWGRTSMRPITQVIKH